MHDATGCVAPCEADCAPVGDLMQVNTISGGTQQVFPLAPHPEKDPAVIVIGVSELLLGSVQVPPGFSSVYSTDRGVTYTGTEPLHGVTHVRVS